MECRGNVQQQLILIPRPQAGTLFLNSISHIFDRIYTFISKPGSLFTFCLSQVAEIGFDFFASACIQLQCLSHQIHSYSCRGFSESLMCVAKTKCKYALQHGRACGKRQMLHHSRDDAMQSLTNTNKPSSIRNNVWTRSKD